MVEFDHCQEEEGGEGTAYWSHRVRRGRRERRGAGLVFCAEARARASGCARGRGAGRAAHAAPSQLSAPHSHTQNVFQFTPINQSRMAHHTRPPRWLSTLPLLLLGLVLLLASPAAAAGDESASLTTRAEGKPEVATTGFDNLPARIFYFEDTTVSNFSRTRS